MTQYLMFVCEDRLYRESLCLSRLSLEFFEGNWCENFPGTLCGVYMVSRSQMHRAKRICRRHGRQQLLLRSWGCCCRIPSCLGDQKQRRPSWFWLESQGPVSILVEDASEVGEVVHHLELFSVDGKGFLLCRMYLLSKNLSLLYVNFKTQSRIGIIEYIQHPLQCSRILCYNRTIS